MYKSIWCIIKKECNRFLKDRRMLISVLLPALLMYGMYTAMCWFMQDSLTVDENYTFWCQVQNAPATYEPIFEGLGFEIMDVTDVETAKEAVANKEADLLVIFPADFDQRLLNPSRDGFVPNIQVFYNMDSTESLLAYDLFLEATEQLETSMVNVLDVNRDVENPDVSTGSTYVLKMIPMLVMVSLFSSCASFAPESIAGEKERGTFATLLVTPVSRTAIAIGKIISLSVFATVAGVSSFVGMILGMNNLMGGEAGMLIPSMATSDYVWLLLVVVTTVLMTIGIVSVISAFAKSVKEATGTASMVTALSTLCGVCNMLPFSFSGIAWRCVPILSTVLSLNDIFLMEYAIADVAVTCVSNLVFVAGLALLLSKMINSEKIMFKKS